MVMTVWCAVFVVVKWSIVLLEQALPSRSRTFPCSTIASSDSPVDDLGLQQVRIWQTLRVLLVNPGIASKGVVEKLACPHAVKVIWVVCVELVDDIGVNLQHRCC